MASFYRIRSVLSLPTLAELPVENLVEGFGYKYWENAPAACISHDVTRLSFQWIALSSHQIIRACKGKVEEIPIEASISRVPYVYDASMSWMHRKR